MLGYEPSEVLSELEISDYTKCAADLGLSPTEFLAKHNPMFKAGADLLQPYVTKIPCFDNRSFQIVSIVSVQGRFGGIRVVGLTAVGLAFE